MWLRQTIQIGQTLSEWFKKEKKEYIYENKKHTDQRHNERGQDPHCPGGLNQCGGACDFCNGCDNLGGGSVDAFYEPYINGEKELRELNEEYRSNTGLVK